MTIIRKTSFNQVNVVQRNHVYPIGRCINVSGRQLVRQIILSRNKLKKTSSYILNPRRQLDYFLITLTFESNESGKVRKMSNTCN
jgi:hypothetical protein